MDSKIQFKYKKERNNRKISQQNDDFMIYMIRVYQYQQEVSNNLQYGYDRAHHVH